MVKEALKKSKTAYENVNHDSLDFSWSMYLRYYNAYRNMICAHVKSNGIEAENCIKEAERELRNIKNGISDLNLTSEQKAWVKGKFGTDVQQLELFIVAVYFRMDPSAIMTQRWAKDTFDQFGKTKELIAWGMAEDRLICPVLMSIYPEITPNVSMEDKCEKIFRGELVRSATEPKYIPKPSKRGL